MKNLGRSLFVVSFGVLVGCAQPPSENSAPQGKFIWNSQKRNEEQQKSLSAILKLNIGSALCSGSHIGNGVVLTAYHCIDTIVSAPKGEEPSLSLSAVGAKVSFGVIKIEDYELSVPKAEKFEKMPTKKGEKEKFNRIPDLAMIKVTGDVGKKIALLPSVKISTETLEVGEDDVTMAGYGLESFGEVVQFGPFVMVVPPESGNLNSGGAEVVSVNEYTYTVQWNHGDTTSAALPGDSGGPLIKISSDGTLTAYAVVSTLGVKPDEEEDSVELVNAYMRLDRGPVREWLDKALSN